MKILIGSHYFFPSTGGIEVVTHLLAREFTRRGHEVIVVTQTPGDGEFPFRVLRQPSATELLAAIRWCDVFLQNNISLRTLWPLAFIRRPLFIIHQTWIAAPDGKQHWSHAVKRFVLRFATSFAISDAIARHLPVTARRINDPYDDTIFQLDALVERERQLIFVGRLVSDKGVDLLLEAMALLKKRRLHPRLTIVGDGPERSKLEAQTRELSLQSDVQFAGVRSSTEIAKLLNAHEILVVPSRWAEPFGLVALEGVACGCVVIGSRDGGLPEAIGPCGVTFPNGDVDALADALATLLRDSAQRDALRAARGPHLAEFTTVAVAERLLAAFAAATV